MVEGGVEDLNLTPMLWFATPVCLVFLSLSAFLEYYVSSTTAHVAIFAVGAYLVFSSYFVANHYMMQLSASYAAIPDDKKFYVLCNLIKSAVLIAYSPLAAKTLFVAMNYDEWSTPRIRNLGVLYAIPDAVSMILVKRMAWSTKVHHLCVVVFAFVNLFVSYEEEGVGRGIARGRSNRLIDRPSPRTTVPTATGKREPRLTTRSPLAPRSLLAGRSPRRLCCLLNLCLSGQPASCLALSASQANALTVRGSRHTSSPRLTSPTLSSNPRRVPFQALTLAPFPCRTLPSPSSPLPATRHHLSLLSLIPSHPSPLSPLTPHPSPLTPNPSPLSPLSALSALSSLSSPLFLPSPLSSPLPPLTLPSPLWL